MIRKTIGKRMAAKLKEIQAELRQRMHESLAETVKWLQSVVRGYFQYHAVPGNEARLKAFRNDVLRLWLRQLRRRSQRSRWTWERFLSDSEPAPGSLQSYIRIRMCALTPNIQGRNRVR